MKDFSSLLAVTTAFLSIALSGYEVCDVRIAAVRQADQKEGSIGLAIGHEVGAFDRSLPAGMLELDLPHGAEMDPAILLPA